MKRPISLILTLVFVLGLSGCKDEAPQERPQTTPTTQKAPAEKTQERQQTASTNQKNTAKEPEKRQRVVLSKPRTQSADKQANTWNSVNLGGNSSSNRTRTSRQSSGGGSIATIGGGKQTARNTQGARKTPQKTVRRKR